MKRQRLKRARTHKQLETSDVEAGFGSCGWGLVYADLRAVANPEALQPARPPPLTQQPTNPLVTHLSMVTSATCSSRSQFLPSSCQR